MTSISALVAVPVLTTSAAASAATEAFAREIVIDASQPSGMRPINARRYFCESHKAQAPREVGLLSHPGSAAAAT